MQNIEELVDLGYNEANARKMLDVCKKHIGEKHGCNKITNVYYTKDARYVELTCELCGKVSERMFVCGRNKWSEFPRTCECQKQKNSSKAEHPRVLYNDDPKYVGSIYGDFKVVDFRYEKHQHKSGGTILWVVECVHCGSRKNIVPGRIKPQDSSCRECECQREKRKTEKWASRVGEKYGRLTITGFEFKKVGVNKSTPYALCRCEC